MPCGHLGVERVAVTLMREERALEWADTFAYRCLACGQIINAHADKVLLWARPQQDGNLGPWFHPGEDA